MVPVSGCLRAVAASSGFVVCDIISSRVQKGRQH